MAFARTRAFVRLVGFAGVLTMTALSGACAEGQPTDKPTERQDPAEFAAELYESGANGDWSEVHPLLAERFSDYENEELEAGLAFPRWSSELGDPGQWQVEDHEDFAVARAVDNPQQALVLKPDSDDSWRYDPGDRAMMLIERRSEGIESPGLPRETNGMSEDAPYQSTLETQARSSDIHQHFQRQLGPIIPGEETVAITLHMTIQGADEIRLPLAGISARTEDGSMLDTHLTGSTAIIEDGVASMPIEGEERAAYRLSLDIDRPEGDGPFEVTFEDIEIVDPQGTSGDTLEFDLHYEDVSVETLPDYLGE